MGFFDNLAASVSKTAREVSDGAKVMADKNRIRKEIASIENELRNRYRDIGQKFYEENKENIPSEYAELFDGIVALGDNLSAKQKELETIEGTVTCPGCGKQFAKGTNFCSGCGQTIPQPQAAAPVEQPQASVCPKCGAQVPLGGAFCTSCGNKMEPVAPAAPQAPAANVCPNCGETLAPDAVFCANCGTKAPGLD